ncbi:MAG: CotH kinase family protein, partial [Verrucomicrobiales bacterium]|nr:CotH kinase family protein [Verrucomicrobiales bacterium]
QTDGGDNTNGGVIPFNGGGGAGMFQMDTVGPDHVPVVNDAVTGGHTSAAGGRDYQFNLVAEFEADPQPPSDISLIAAELFPGIPTGTSLGNFETTDPNTSDTHNYELIANPGNIFALNGASLQTAGTIGNPGTEYQIRVRSTDPENLSIEKNFTLTVAAAAPPANLSFSTSTVNAGSIPGSAVGQFSVTDPNSGDSHTYSLVAGDGDSDNGLLTVDANWLGLGQAIPEGRTKISFRIRVADLSGLSIESSFSLAVSDPSLRLNEYLASNGNFARDEDGEFSDWIEIFNEQAAPANLNGWFLTDDSDNLTKWQFPNNSIPANGYLVVFASGKNRSSAAGELHTSFQLSSSGEYIALVKPDGVTIASQFLRKPQYSDVAYGITSAGNGEGYLSPPTPGAANGEAYAFGENTVAFSHPRGFYDSEFQLTLSATSAGSTIRYTTDGSIPTATHGTVYNTPITIAPDSSSTTRGTRRIRAFAVNNSAPPGDVATHTYLFVNGANAPGTDGIVSQSGLRTQIRNHATYGPLMDDALLALPAISIIGSNPGSGERETSIEFFSPDASEPGFQIDCGIKVVGGHSVGSPKNNFRLYFRSQYGEPNLKYPLFEDQRFSIGATDVFDRLNLRSGSHDTFFWLGNQSNPPAGSRRGDACMLRNRWICDMQFLMGNESLRGRFTHVFLNGRYHGQYQIMELPNHDYLASYLGGEDTDYHFTNGASASKTGSDHGGGDTWAQNWNQIKRSASTSWEAAQSYIDVENLADYMLLSFYAGNTWDWNPNQNWMAGGPKTPGAGGWKFFSWDCDIILQGVDHNNLGKNVPDGLFSLMMSRQPDFKVLFRDRVYKHCFNGGVLTPSVPQAIMDHWEQEINLSIIAETARWQPASPASAPWDRDGEWKSELRHYRNTWFPRRTNILLQQLRARGWYPLDAPEFAQRGGAVPPGYRPQISAAPGDKIYVTTDGSDPRLPGGDINPNAVLLTPGAGTSTVTVIEKESVWRYLDDGSNQGTAWRSTGFNDTAWEENQAELGYGDNNENTVVSYGPDIANKFITTYFRKAFDVADASSITALGIELLRDDGAAVYINGIEVWRDNLPEVGTIDYRTQASASLRGTDESAFISKLDVTPTVLVDGTNVIAV